MAKVSLTAKDLLSLIESSRRMGKQDAALDLAVEWIEAADAEITLLTTELEKATEETEEKQV